MVHRAVQFAMTEPKGPSYLCAAREVLEEEIAPYQINTKFWQPVQPAALPEDGVKTIAEALRNAKNPLVVTAYAGRNENAVDELVKLADKIPVRVLDTGSQDLCFPHNHKSAYFI